MHFVGVACRTSVRSALRLRVHERFINWISGPCRHRFLRFRGQTRYRLNCAGWGRKSSPPRKAGYCLAPICP
ncbi:hypothetical protein D5047_21665 [Verminephrobacter eiseniae]|nr:hypothetical protein [Verminephrobacter eiseniae]